jgi:hypothetical protein
MSGTNSQMITITLDLNKSNLILHALAKLPWETSNDLILELRQQIVKQVNPPGRQEQPSLSLVNQGE